MYMLGPYSCNFIIGLTCIVQLSLAKISTTSPLRYKVIEDANCLDVWWLSRLLMVMFMLVRPMKLSLLNGLSKNKSNYKETTR